MLSETLKVFKIIKISIFFFFCFDEIKKDKIHKKNNDIYSLL